MVEAARFVNGQLDHLFGAWRQANFARNWTVSTANDMLDRPAHFLNIHVEAFEYCGGDAPAFVHQAEQKMLSADIVMLETLRFFLGKLHDPSGSFGEPVKFVAVVSLAARTSSRTSATERPDDVTKCVMYCHFLILS